MGFPVVWDPALPKDMMEIRDGRVVWSAYESRASSLATPGR